MKKIYFKIALMFVLTSVWFAGVCCADSLIGGGHLVLLACLVLLPLVGFAWSCASGYIDDLLVLIEDIEKRLGRTVKSVDGKYHDRPIDCDMLMYDDVNISTPTITLPHPHMHERYVVMIPLREIL